MNISLKSIKYSEFASQETHCFEATVYIDNKRAFIASNDGHGGCNMYHPLPNDKRAQNEIFKVVKELDEQLGKETITFESGDQEFSLPNSLDIVVGNLINEHLTMKEAKRLLKRITYVQDGSIYQLAAKFKPIAENLKKIKTADWWKKDNILLNELSIEQVVKHI